MSIKSLLHFNSEFVVDEVDNGINWSKTPCLLNRNTARFGTGCLVNNKLEANFTPSENNVFNISPDGAYEFEMFVKFIAPYYDFGEFEYEKDTLLLQGYTDYNLTTGVGTPFQLKLGINDYHYTITASCLENTIDNIYYIYTNEWRHILLRIHNSKLEFYVDGIRYCTEKFNLPSTLFASSFILNAEAGETVASGSKAILGEVSVCIDEFVFRNNAGTGEFTAPTKAYSLEVQSTPTPTNSILPLSGSIQLRGGTSEVLTNVNPLLLAREIMIETDTGRTKIGDGIHHWNNLIYTSSSTHELPTVDNKIYVIKNGRYVSASPEIDFVAPIPYMFGKEITPYQFTGTNTEVNI